MNVRPATADDLPAVMTVLDAGLLETDAGTVRERIADGDALVAVEDGRVLGALLARPTAGGAHVEAVAVRPRRRGQGIGTALVEALDAPVVTAAFDPPVRPFYERLGFAIEERDGRLWGVREG